MEMLFSHSQFGSNFIRTEMLFLLGYCSKFKHGIRVRNVVLSKPFGSDLIGVEVLNVQAILVQPYNDGNVKFHPSYNMTVSVSWG